MAVILSKYKGKQKKSKKNLLNRNINISLKLKQSGGSGRAPQIRFVGSNVNQLKPKPKTKGFGYYTKRLIPGTIAVVPSAIKAGLSTAIERARLKSKKRQLEKNINSLPDGKKKENLGKELKGIESYLSKSKTEIFKEKFKKDLKKATNSPESFVRWTGSTFVARPVRLAVGVPVGLGEALLRKTKKVENLETTAKVDKALKSLLSPSRLKQKISSGYNTLKATVPGAISDLFTNIKRRAQNTFTDASKQGKVLKQRLAEDLGRINKLEESSTKLAKEIRQKQDEIAQLQSIPNRTSEQSDTLFRLKTEVSSREDILIQNRGLIDAIQRTSIEPQKERFEKLGEKYENQIKAYAKAFNKYNPDAFGTLEYEFGKITGENEAQLEAKITELGLSNEGDSIKEALKQEKIDALKALYDTPPEGETGKIYNDVELKDNLKTLYALIKITPKGTTRDKLIKFSEELGDFVDRKEKSTTIKTYKDIIDLTSAKTTELSNQSKSALNKGVISETGARYLGQIAQPGLFTLAERLRNEANARKTTKRLINQIKTSTNLTNTERAEAISLIQSNPKVTSSYIIELRRVNSTDTEEKTFNLEELRSRIENNRAATNTAAPAATNTAVQETITGNHTGNPEIGDSSV